MPARSQPVNNTKYFSELAYWKARHQAEGGKFLNGWYRKIFLAMAGEPDDSFLDGKVVADFGCGPRGSLMWVRSSATKIGIDILADLYSDEFAEDIVSHGMLYVKSTEAIIPIPTGFCDFVFTLNAIDHVDNFQVMCEEILRVLKPGGDFIASFNLNEPPTDCEPQTLTEALIDRTLLDRLEVISRRRARRPGEGAGNYQNFFTENYEFTDGDLGFLWVRARKPLEK